MKNLRSVRSLSILGLVLFLFAVCQVQPGAAQPAKEIGPLLAQAQAQGSTRVIVGLRGTFQLDGRLARTAAESQRTAITQAQDALLNQMTTQNIRSSRKFEFIPYLVMEVDANALAFLASSPSVASIVEDKPRAPSLAESTALIGATNAWASGYAGAGQTVAILDTGVDKTHAFLTNKVVSEACYSTNTSGSGYISSTVCPGGATQSTATGSGVNCDLAIEGCDHGTHVAGIAAGKDPGGVGFSGVARDANIIAIQVFSRFDSATYCPNGSPCALSWDSDQLSALERVYALRGAYSISSVNLSLGGGSYSSTCDGDTPAYTTAVNNLRSVGIATVIASGNSGYTNSMSFPACISTAISVGSTKDGGPGATPVDTVSSFSNSASFLKLLAPGQYIYSSVPGGGYENWAGTSMATPHVTGAWAVIKSGVPSATVDQILAALTNTGVSVYDSRNGITKPRIRLDAALNALAPFTPTPSSTPTRTSTPTITPTPTRTRTPGPAPTSIINLPLIEKALVPGWTTILNTTFEGDFPGPWYVADADGVTNGEYKWGARGCRSYTGSYSGWAVGAGTHGGALSCGSYYPLNNSSWMIYGPFSLANTSAGELRAQIWTRSEMTFDNLCFFASTDNYYYYGTCYSGNFAWGEKTLDLANVYTLGNLLGQPNVWVAFVFQSDFLVNYPEGAYVDDILLRKCPSGASCPASPSPAMPNKQGVANPASKIRPR